MGTLFSDTLVRLRKEAGFPTAYRFYYDCGGAPALKVSYRKYLLMEQGKILPVIGRLQKLSQYLRILPGAPSANELAVAWLKTMAGEEVYSDVFEPLISYRPGEGALPPADKALRRALAEKKYTMTPGQFAATLSSFETYKCSMAMESDTGVWSAADIAKALRLKPSAALRSLRELVKAGLAKEVKKGSFRSLVAGRMVQCPDLAGIDPGLRLKQKDYFKRLETDGSLEYASTGVLRADGLALRSYFPLMCANVEASGAYAITGKTERSAFYYVVGKVVRLWDF